MTNDREAYEAGLLKLGLLRPMHGDDLWPPAVIDLRQDPAFAWRVLVQLRKTDVDRFDDWASTHQGVDLASALYAAVVHAGQEPPKSNAPIGWSRK